MFSRSFGPLVAILSLLVLGRSAAAAPQSRPNIIVLITDDQRHDSIAALGHPYVKTPHLDRLIGESVRFRNAYAASPVCAPSRVSFFTGMLERVHGVGFSSGYQLSEEQWARTYPALLRAAGYHTGFIGKFGVEYYPFRGRAADKFDYWWAHDGWTKFFPKDRDTPSTRPYHAAKEEIITPIMGEAMMKFLETAPADKPFCLSVSFNVPHGSQTTSMHEGFPNSQLMLRPANENPKLAGHPFYGSLYRDLDIPIPPETGGDPYRLIPRFILDQDKGRRKLYEYNYSRDGCREHHIRYHQQITGVDHVIGRLRAELDRRGLADDTVIVYGSDHGLLMGEYGMGGKELLLDLAAKIPCFVHDPRLPAALRGRALPHLVAGIDYTRTILDYAGVEPPSFMDGASLRPLVEGRETPWRSELFLESLFAMRDNPFQEAVRTDRWKYIRLFDGVQGWRDADVDFTGRTPAFEMLFDLQADPGETNNFADDPSRAETLAALRGRCVEESAKLVARRREFTAAVRTEPRR